MSETFTKDVEVTVGGIEEEDCNGGKRKWWQSRVFQGACLVVLICIGVALGVGMAGGSGKEAKATQSSKDSNLVGPSGSCDVVPDKNEEESYMYTGCFQDSPSDDSHNLFCGTSSLRAKECSEKCYTRFFTVNDATQTCKCFSLPPTERISIGSCPSPNNRTRRRRAQEGNAGLVELFFNKATSTTCSQSNTETVRNKLVEEDNAQFGFDIVSNTWRTSPFELFSDGCGTNMYKINTDVSEDTFSTRTEVLDITEYAEMKRTERSQSYSMSVEAEARIKIVDVAASVSATYDAEQTNLFQSSGASEVGSKVFISQGVKRVARVEMEDVDGARSFVTLSSAFGNRIRNYLDGGFQRQTAFDILDHYGQFVLTRGMFGGFMELRMTMTSSDYRDSRLDSSTASSCFEATVAGEVGVLGLGKVSSQYSAGFCSSDQKESMRASRSSFRDETNEASFRGARSSCTDPNDVSTCSFEVDGESSELLITNDKYPPNDRGVHFQLLSDFLSPEKISPLEVRRLQITEDEFAQIQENLEKHTKEYLEDVEESLGGCNCGADDVVYLVADTSGNGRFGCECYDPDPAGTRAPSPSPTPMPTQYGCNGVPHGVSPNSSSEPKFVGSKEGSMWCKGPFNACFAGSTFQEFETQYGKTSKWFKGEAFDQDSCSASVKHRVTLYSPYGANYDLKVYIDDSRNFYDSSTNSLELPLLFSSYSHADQVELSQQNKGYTYWVYVEYVSGSSCDPWKLTFEHYQCDN